MVLFIPADLSQPMEIRTILPNLNTMQSLVGGLIEAIDVFNPTATLWANEEGKLAQLPQNDRATALALTHNGRFFDFIVGDAFITGLTDDGDTDDCPEAYLELADE